MALIPCYDTLPDSLLAGLADRDVSIWVAGSVGAQVEIGSLVSMLRLPWKQVFLEQTDSKVIAALETPDSGPLVRRRGFVHMVDTDPSRMNLPPRALPVFLLGGRDGRGSAFDRQLRRMTMMEELRRSGIRQLVLLGHDNETAASVLEDIWASGFRTRLSVVDERADAARRLGEWLDANGQGPTASIISLSVEGFSRRIATAFASSYADEKLIVRQRDEAGSIRQIDLTSIDDPERPLLDDYDLILDRDFAPINTEELSEDAFNAFFRGEHGDWRAFAADLPWIRDDSAWLGLQAHLRRIDLAGSPENRIAYIVSEPGAGGTTLARHLAFTAARAGYPTLVAKDLPFTPDALPVVNFLTRTKQQSEDLDLSKTKADRSEPDTRLYETPWLLVYDRVHWEFREAELRHFLRQLERAGRPVCILVVIGPSKGLAYSDESRFTSLTELHHMLDETETLELGRHLNCFLRNYGKERPEWQWRNFQQAHSVRYLEGLAAFWVTLAFWLQTQFDLSDSIQNWIYGAFKKSADTPELRKAVLQIAALSSERLPMPESLIEQGSSAWPVPLLLDDRRSALSPLGLTRLSHAGRKYWAMAHDILGRLLINALFYDYDARSSLGLDAAKDGQHLQFLILREISCKRALGEAAERDYAEEFATTVFKIDPDHGRASWIHIWREVLAALDEMPGALRNGSRVFRHHTAISRRRIAWLDETAYGISSDDRVSLLRRAIEDITYALNSIEMTPGDEPDINLYNSLANAYFDLARVRADQGAPVDELAELRRKASDATRHAYEQNPSSPYVIETHVKSSIASAEEGPEFAADYCIEALEIVYAAIRDDRNELRRHALASLADRAVGVLMSAKAKSRRLNEPESATEVLVGAWITLTTPFGGRAPELLGDVPSDALMEALRELEHPAGIGNAQVARLRYQVLVAAAPLDFKRQLEALELLVSTDYRLPPQLKLEYALLLFQQMRTQEGHQEFKTLRMLWRDTDIFVQVPDRLRWLLEPSSDRPRIVTAVSAYDHGHRAMARVREFTRFDVPYRPQEFGVREHRPGNVFSAQVSFGHNGPFLRPVGVPRR